MTQVFNLKYRVGLCASLAMLMAASCVIPNAQAKLGDPKDPKWTRPAKPTITQPTQGSRLMDEKRITVSGAGLVTSRPGGWRFYNIAGTITATHVRNGKRVRATAWGQTKSFIAGTDRNGKWENKTVDLPKLEAGWSDVVYEISVKQSARPERDDHPTLEVNPLASEALIINVHPYKQPAPTPDTPKVGTVGSAGGSGGAATLAKPVISSPRAGARLPNASTISINGTGTPGATVDIYIQPVYTQEGQTGRKTGKLNSTKTTVNSQGRWDKKNWALPDLQRGWLDARYKISVSQQKSAVNSGQATFEVHPNVQPGKLSFRDGMVVAPTKHGNILNKIPVPTERLLLRFSITSPTKDAKVKSPLKLAGTASAGSQVQIQIVFLGIVNPNDPKGNLMGASRQVGVFTVKASSKGEWHTNPIHLNGERTRFEQMYEITATEIYSGGSKGTPIKIKVSSQ